jgi:hypothetical protein
MKRFSMSDSDAGHGENLPDPTPEDFIDYLQGKSTPEQNQRIQAALNYPDSELNTWLKGVRQWARKSLPGQAHSTSRPISHRRRSEPSKELDGVIEFVRQKRLANVFTDEDVSLIAAAAGFGDDASAPPTPNESIAIASKMVNAINDLHPELASEIAQLRSSRLR